jgi:hypothetical protein
MNSFYNQSRTPSAFQEFSKKQDESESPCRLKILESANALFDDLPDNDDLDDLFEEKPLLELNKQGSLKLVSLISPMCVLLKNNEV